MVSRNDGFGRGSGGFSIGAVSVCTVAFCSSACAGEMSVTNTRAILINSISGRPNTSRSYLSYNLRDNET